MSVLSNGATRPVVRKKAALCLLRLIRKAPFDMEVMPAGEWAGRFAAMLEERDPGLLLGLTTLLLGIVSRSYEGYEVCVPRMVHILDRLKARDVSQDYTYYGLASPWLQVRTLRVLQYFPPPEDPAVLRALMDTLQRTLAGNDPIKNPNKSNAMHAIVFEAAALAVGLGDPELLNMAVALLARFLTVRESNLKYLALENMGRLAQAPAMAEAVARHHKTVVACLHDPDISIRRRALDLVFTTATASSAPEVVDELLKELPHADFAMKEEVVLKAAVLAERFPPSSEWYVDAMLRLMEAAGDTVMDDVWHSVVQLVAAEPPLQRYAPEKVVEALKRGASSDVFLRCAAFVLGEHGRSIAQNVPLKAQFDLLHVRFPGALPETKAMMLTAFEKLRAAGRGGDAALNAAVVEMLDRYSSALDAELQQRAVEYRGLMERPGAEAIALQALPPWEKRSSLLLRRLVGRKGEEEEEAREQPAWLQAAQESEEAKQKQQQQKEGGGGVMLEGGGGGGGGEGEAAGNGNEVVEEEEEEEEESQQLALPAAPAPVIPDLLDLLDFNDDDVDQQPPTTTTETAPPSEMDPHLAALSGLAVPPIALSSNPFAESPSPSSSQQQQHIAPPPIEPTGDISAWFSALCQGRSGVLYEDPNVQIGVKLTMQGGASGRLDLYLGNKSQQPLAKLLCATPPLPGFALALGAPPLMLEPGRQVQLSLDVTCLTPFTRPPVLQLGYTVVGGPFGGGAVMARTLDLPLVVTKFCTPMEVPVAVFTTRWAQVVGAPFKLAQQVTCCGGVDDVARLLSVLQLQILSGVDSTPGTVCAACVFHCGVAPQTRQVPCMVKVEGLAAGGTAAKLTVATADAMISAALKEELAQQLTSLG